MHIRSPWRKRAVAAGAVALAVPLAFSAGVANAAPTAAPAAVPMKAAAPLAFCDPFGPVPTTACVTAPPRIQGQTWNFSVYSPAMARPVPVQLLVPPGYNQRGSTTYPELYQLDGIESKPTTTDWALKSDSQKFFSNKNVLVVQPIGGFASQKMNWQKDDPAIISKSEPQTGHLKWEDFLVDELPNVIRDSFNGNGRRAITGISTGAFAAFDFAANHPGRYKAAASYSGYPEIQSPGLPQFLLYSESSKGGATDPNNLFGLPVGSGPLWERNNVGTPANLAKLRSSGVSLYMSAGTGASGPFDKPSGFFGLSESFDGSVIEFITNYSSQLFAREAANAGVQVTSDLTNPGIHDWPYWNVQYKKSWPQLAQAIGVAPGNSVGGLIAIRYQLTGAAGGFLGSPITNEIFLPGGIFQRFEKGYIYYSGGPAAFSVHGAILDFWGSQGFERSRFGYPTSEEYSQDGGLSVYQNFQGGRIHYVFGQGIRP